jgi:Na+-transporting methylmalonyl-CoA/oxaloacetate decarboxylase gamma subunit
MNKKLDFKGIMIVSLVLLFLIYLINFILKCDSKKTENFQSNSETKFNELTGDDLMDQRYERARQELVLDTVEDSIERSIEKQGQLTFENADTNSALMDEYVNNIINNDIGNPNRLLEDGDQYELPSVVEDNLNKYNHELRKLNISKQIKQDYLIKVLRNKIEVLLTSLKSVPEIRQDFEKLKLPENRHVVKILKIDADN